ncbi:hypothetical protein [Paraburkholderia sp. BL21I4N1]|uniref:hypothetical protein n=1 Tax=Paraburkholderia sp. BL21I4N1 TaxID=1938801 RepID=UPI000D4AC913|nr:hypothetical protein [Paraburkholderia sp. BL21I4N1]PQV52173.1 hypothetical protein B0G83_104393 [Paraburkholderia sp. BL21I4N1]
MSDTNVHRAGATVSKSGIYTVRFLDDKVPASVNALCLKGEQFISSARPAEFSLQHEAERQGDVKELQPYTP